MLGCALIPHGCAVAAHTMSAACWCVAQCVLEDCTSSASASKPPASCPVTTSTSMPSVPFLTLTAVSQTSLSMALSPTPSNGSAASTTQRVSSANLLQAFDRLSISTTNMTAAASPSAGRRLSLGALRVSSSQHRQVSSSTLLVDGVNALSRPNDTESARRAVTSGRSPRVRRKLGRASGRAKDKRASTTKLSKLVLEPKPPPPVVDDWPLKFDLSALMPASAVASSADVGGADDAASGDEDAAGSVATAASFVDVADAVSHQIDNSELYADLALLTRSVGMFNKLAYPDMHGHMVTPFKEAFYEKRFGTQR